MQLYSLGTPNGQKVTIMLEELLQRGHTGRGCRIDVSMLESMTEWMTYPLYYAYEGASPPPRAGAAAAPARPVTRRRTALL